MPDTQTWGKRPAKKTAASPKQVDAFVSDTEPKKTARLNFVISDDLHQRVKAGCVMERVSMTDVVVELLESRFPKTRS